MPWREKVTLNFLLAHFRSKKKKKKKKKISLGLSCIIILLGGGTEYINPKTSFVGSSTSVSSYALALYSGLWAYEGW